MESRKRPRVEDSELLHSKKRVISDSRDSPVPTNGVSDVDEPKDGDSLEVNTRTLDISAMFSLNVVSDIS